MPTLSPENHDNESQTLKKINQLSADSLPDIETILTARLPVLSGGKVPVDVGTSTGSTSAISDFTSTAANSSLVGASASRKVLTVFNAGAGTLYIAPGAACTTTSYQVRLASGDYWEAPLNQVTMAHSAVFGSAGTAEVTQIS